MLKIGICVFFLISSISKTRDKDTIEWVKVPNAFEQDDFNQQNFAIFFPLAVAPGWLG